MENRMAFWKNKPMLSYKSCSPRRVAGEASGESVADFAEREV
jgi:hypothetical protein